jgi:hypothetical protein
MKDQIRMFAIILGVIILVAELAYSKVELVPECDSEDSLVKQTTGIKIGLHELPKVVLVARESVQEILGKDMMVVSKQSFIKPQSKVECAKFIKLDQKNYSLTAPVLIDLSAEQKIKNSYWQFQSMIQQSKVGVWNQKSKLAGDQQSLEEWIKTQNSEIEFFQVTHDQYMMQIRLKEKDQVIIQRIYYDQMQE